MNSENKETFAQHFNALPLPTGVREAAAALTDGEYPDSRIMDFEHWPRLLGHCADFINDMADVEFNGRYSMHLVMQVAMKRLYRIDGYHAPAPWLPIIRVLKLGGPLQYRPGEEQDERERRQEEKRAEWDKWMPKECRPTKNNMVAWKRGSQAIIEWSREAEIVIKPPYPPAITDAPPLDTYAEGWRYLATAPALPEPLEKLRDWLREKAPAQLDSNM